MTVEGHITTADVQDPGNQGGPIQVLAPILKENIRLLVGQNLDSFPDGHALLEVLFFHLRDADRFDGALGQSVPLLHGSFVAARLPGDFSGNIEFDRFL
jgi:hypothetical protein